MTTLNKLVENLTHKVVEDSASWGALIILICGLSVLLLMMMTFSYNY